MWPQVTGVLLWTSAAGVAPDGTVTVTTDIFHHILPFFFFFKSSVADLFYFLKNEILKTNSTILTVCEAE